MYKLTTIDQSINQLTEVDRQLVNINDEPLINLANHKITEAIEILIKVKDSITQELEERR